MPTRPNTGTLSTDQIDRLAAYAVQGDDETAQELGRELMDELGPALTEQILDDIMAAHADEREAARAKLEAGDATPVVRVAS